MEAVKFLKTLPPLTRWDITHTVQTILSPEMVLTHTLAVKVELLHGTVTTMDTATDHLQQAALMVTCTIYGDTGLKDLSPSHPTQHTITILTNSDSDGQKLMLIQHQTADITHTTTGVTTTPHTMVDKVHSSLLKDTLVDHTTSVSIMHTHIT
jgi:hypothetical protein